MKAASLLETAGHTPHIQLVPGTQMSSFNYDTGES